MRYFARIPSLALAMHCSCAAGAQEVSTYSYDARGQFAQSSIAGGPRNGQATVTCYDRAGNRTNYAVATVPPGCASSTPIFYTAQIGALTDLAANQYVISGDGRFKLIYQTDGNLVLYMNGSTPLWASNTGGTSPGRASFDSYGRLNLFNGAGNFVWTWTPGTATAGPYGFLAVQNDGNVVAYDANGAAVWSTGTCCH